MVKKGYYGNKGLNLAWNLGVIFLGVPNHTGCENCGGGGGSGGGREKRMWMIDFKSTLFPLINSSLV